MYNSKRSSKKVHTHIHTRARARARQI